jgi:hypothetical protein
MYDVKPNFVIGFHGCDASVCKVLLNNPDNIKISKNPYDWLGYGMYFWENNYERAWQWAFDKHRRGEINHPAVIGAVLQLGFCCDFLETKFTRMLSDYHRKLVERYIDVGIDLPTNKDIPHDKHKTKILRELDCAAIEFMHVEILQEMRTDEEVKGFTKRKAFDSTRGAFIEGAPIYEGAGIYEKTHIQICIRNLNCIKGFFLPRREIDFLNCFEVNEPAIPFKFELWQ